MILEEHKIAGLGAVGEGALFAILLGAIVRRIPALSALRVNNPAAYDAALGASVVTLQNSINQRREPERPQLLPGQTLEPTRLLPPDWNLM